MGGRTHEQTADEHDHECEGGRQVMHSVSFSGCFVASVLLIDSPWSTD